MTDRPNFLFITTDQHRADHLGCYGNPIVKTPAIDQLAARGTTFENFFVACPICMPNRVAILTGRMPTVNGTRHNGIPLSKDAVTFVDVLRAGGYHTGIVGKSHVQNITGQDLRNPDIFDRSKQGEPLVADAFHTARTGPEYEAELMPEWHRNPDRDGPELPYYGYEFVRFANGHADHVQGHYTRWLGQHAQAPDKLRGPKNALPQQGLVAPQAWRTAIPEELYPTTYVAQTSVDFINHHLETRPEDPFFLHCSFPDPHHPFTPPGKYFDMYDPAEMPLPKSFDHIDPFEPSMVTRLRKEQAEARGDRLGPLPFCVTAEETRQILALTYGMISMVDDAVQNVLTHLEAKGILNETVIIFTSDHGDFMGDHGLMLKHGLHYDGVLRVPCIWVDPDAPEPRRTELHGSSVDLSAMILGRAGIVPNNGNQGVDLLRHLAENTVPSRAGVLVEEDELGAHLGTPEGLRTRSYIENNWRVTVWQGMEGGELFDRNSDPEELQNLWYSSDFEGKKSKMLEAMLREMIRLTDTAPFATAIA